MKGLDLYARGRHAVMVEGMKRMENRLAGEVGLVFQPAAQGR